MLIEGGKKSSVEYISNTNPIPKDAISIARKTAGRGKISRTSNYICRCGEVVLRIVLAER